MRSTDEHEEHSAQSAPERAGVALVQTHSPTREQLKAHPMPWCWSDSLGGVAASAGARLVVDQIRLGSRYRCGLIGLREGQEIRFRRRSRDGVTVELPSGDVRTLELPHAWFVAVRPLATSSVPNPTPHLDLVR